jgi:hypothetical protein
VAYIFSLPQTRHSQSSANDPEPSVKINFKAR